jgi:hypothetical protein
MEEIIRKKEYLKSLIIQNPRPNFVNAFNDLEIEVEAMYDKLRLLKGA